jgi:hypothetical protein
MWRPSNAIHVDFGPLDLHGSADQVFGKDDRQLENQILLPISSGQLWTSIGKSALRLFRLAA